MVIAAYTQNLHTGKSYYEDEYMQTIAHYKDSKVISKFASAIPHAMKEHIEYRYLYTGHVNINTVIQMSWADYSL
jgi:hypothetical protein